VKSAIERSPPADRHRAQEKGSSNRRPWVIHVDPSTVTTESKVLNLSEVKRAPQGLLYTIRARL